MQLMFVLGLEHALSRLDNASLKECTRIGLQDDILAKAGHLALELQGQGVCSWYEQFEDRALPDDIRGLRMKLSRQRCGIELSGSAANAARTMQVAPGPGVTVPSQTTKRVDHALDTQRICSTWPRQLCLGVDACQPMVAHAIDNVLRLVPLAMIASLQRRMEGGIRRSVSSLVGSSVEEARLPTCDGGPGIRVPQMVFTGQATFWSAVDLHLAVMPRICDALGRLIVGRHPESGTGPDGENGAARGRSCR